MGDRGEEHLPVAPIVSIEGLLGCDPGVIDQLVGVDAHVRSGLDTGEIEPGVEPGRRFLGRHPAGHQSELLAVESEPGRGTAFTIRLPLADATELSLHLPAEQPSGARGRVLLVDDEPRVLSVLERMLAGTHEVVAVGGAREALEQLSRGLPFDVIVCDLLMPDMSGIDLYRVLEERAPHLARRMIFLSGGANTSVAGEFFSEVPNQALEKPPARSDLLLAIDRELGGQDRVSYHPVPSGVVPRAPKSETN